MRKEEEIYSFIKIYLEFEYNLSRDLRCRRNDTRQNVTRQNDTQHNDTRHEDIHYNYIQFDFA
jgi:hypothetical protein